MVNRFSLAPRFFAHHYLKATQDKNEISAVFQAGALLFLCLLQSLIKLRPRHSIRFGGKWDRQIFWVMQIHCAITPITQNQSIIIVECVFR